MAPILPTEWTVNQEKKILSLLYETKKNKRGLAASGYLSSKVLCYHMPTQPCAAPTALLRCSAGHTQISKKTEPTLARAHNHTGQKDPAMNSNERSSVRCRLTTPGSSGMHSVY